MKEGRFKETGRDSFWGDYLYEQVVPSDHFLRQLERVIDWQAFGERLIELYVGQGEMGRPPYDPVLLLKMLLLAYLFNLSERRVEAWVNDSLAARWFLHLAANEAAPDHTTLSAFKKRIVERGQEACLEGLLQEVIRQALARGVRFGQVQVVDSTHVVANVNVAQEEQRQAAGQAPRDTGALGGERGARGARREGCAGGTQGVFLWLQGARQSECGGGDDHECGGDGGECPGWQAVGRAGGARPRPRVAG